MGEERLATEALVARVCGDPFWQLRLGEGMSGLPWQGDPGLVVWDLLVAVASGLRLKAC